MTPTQQFIIALVTLVLGQYVSYLKLKSSTDSNHAETTASLAAQHEQLNGQQDKLIAAVKDAATQRGAQEERDKGTM